MQIYSPVKVSNTASVQHDNLFDVIFSDKGRLKEVGKKVHLTGDKLNILEGSLEFKPDDSASFDMGKVKINKRFPLVSMVPKLSSVSATPQFFDMALQHIDYPDIEVEKKKYEAQGGLSSYIGSFFGGGQKWEINK